ncbi:MAG TPA: hypothetical protein VIM53_04805 [Candidatus Saccharimonadales bacterium]
MEHETKKKLQVKNLRRLRKPIASAAIAVVVAGVGFYGGVSYQKHHTASNNGVGTMASAQNASGRSGFGGGFGGGGSRADRVIGQVTAVSSTSITVQTQSGSSSTLAITSSTTITDNGQSATTSDIQVGDTVFITEDSSNTSQASRIMVNPSFGGGQSSQSDAQTQSD